jgi:hypothetical protein
MPNKNNIIIISIIIIINIITSINIMVFLDALVSPVSPWTLRAPGQVVRNLRLSVGQVLSGEHFYIWGKTCVLEKRSL